MRIIYDVANHHKCIKESIKAYGHFAEHNFLHYMYKETGSCKNVFFDFGNSRGLLSQMDSKNNSWNLFPDGILAPESERLDLFLEAANYILNKQKAKKFAVEATESLRGSILGRLKAGNEFRACNNNYVLYWPLYNLGLWDLNLKGSKWKKLRNIRNRFYRANNVMVKDSKDVPKGELMAILSGWLKKRSRSDRVDRDYFLKMINNSFEGIDMAKTMYVNGKPSTITAGWRIPNSNSYYSSIGILDYSCPGLGEIANIDDLNRLKSQGYAYADFGGSERALLCFKKKFMPEKIYKTYIFSVVRK